MKILGSIKIITLDINQTKGTVPELYLKKDCTSN